MSVLPRLLPSQQWRGRRWQQGKEHSSRAAFDPPPFLTPGRTQNHQSMFQCCPVPVLSHQRDPCKHRYVDKCMMTHAVLVHKIMDTIKFQCQLSYAMAPSILTWGYYVLTWGYYVLTWGHYVLTWGCYVLAWGCYILEC